MPNVDKCMGLVYLTTQCFTRDVMLLEKITQTLADPRLDMHKTECRKHCLNLNTRAAFLVVATSSITVQDVNTMGSIDVDCITTMHSTEAITPEPLYGNIASRSIITQPTVKCNMKIDSTRVIGPIVCSHG